MDVDGSFRGWSSDSVAPPRKGATKVRFCLPYVPRSEIGIVGKARSGHSIPRLPQKFTSNRPRSKGDSRAPLARGSDRLPYDLAKISPTGRSNLTHVVT